eukprot:8115085-Pyramimonas_sp.AAC.1
MCIRDRFCSGYTGYEYNKTNLIGNPNIIGRWHNIDDQNGVKLLRVDPEWTEKKDEAWHGGKGGKHHFHAKRLFLMFLVSLAGDANQPRVETWYPRRVQGPCVVASVPTVPSDCTSGCSIMYQEGREEAQMKFQYASDCTSDCTSDRRCSSVLTVLLPALLTYFDCTSDTGDAMFDDPELNGARAEDERAMQ